MFCRRCGAKIEEGAKFCMKCGTAVTGAPNAGPESPGEVSAGTSETPRIRPAAGEEATPAADSAEIRRDAPPQPAQVNSADYGQTPLYTARTFSPSPAPAEPDRSAFRSGVPAPRKKPIIVLAVVALVMTSLSSLLSLVFTLGLSSGVTPSMYLLELLRSNTLTFLIRFILPQFIAGLFLIFCCLVNKAHVLPAIPPAISCIVSFFSAVSTALALLGRSSVINILLSLVLQSFFLTFTVIVLIALAGRFGRTVAGKVLTLVSGIVYIAVDSSAAVVSLSNNTRLYASYRIASGGMIAVNALASLCGLAASILTAVALIRCVFYVAALKRYRESAGGAV